MSAVIGYRINIQLVNQLFYISWNSRNDTFTLIYNKTIHINQLASICICKEHRRCSYTQCTVHKEKYPSRKRKIGWCCNVQHIKKMYVSDSKSGFVWTNMKYVPRER